MALAGTDANRRGKRGWWKKKIRLALPVHLPPALTASTTATRHPAIAALNIAANMRAWETLGHAIGIKAMEGWRS